MVGWNRFFHGGFVENADNNYGVGLADLMTWRLISERRHQDRDSVAAME